jgi:lipopolysaccharide export system permease protein
MATATLPSGIGAPGGRAGSAPAGNAPAGARSARRRVRFGSALDRYVFWEFAKIFTVTALGFPLLVYVIDLVDNLNKFLERQIPPRDLVVSYVYWTPETMFNVLPAAVLFATVFTIGAVTRHSEITAAKASGISFYRFILPIVFGATIATGLGLVLGEVAPRANARRLVLLKETRDVGGSARANFAYAAEGGRVYKAGQLSVGAGVLTRVEIERKGNGPDYPGVLTAAEEARYRAVPAGAVSDSGGGWVLARGTTHLIPSDTSVLSFQFDSLVDRRMKERPRDLMVTPKAPDDMDFEELGRFIKAMERSGAEVNALRVSRMLKISIPATCVIILLFGAPLATSTQRGGAAYGVGLSLGTTVLFLVLIQLTRAIGGKGIITPELAAWVPSAVFGVAGAILLSRTRT